MTQHTYSDDCTCQKCTDEFNRVLFSAIDKKVKRNPGFIKRNPRIIKRNPPMQIQFPVKNLGGHLPYPPDDCKRKDMWTKYNDMIWIDFVICISCENYKYCETRTNYLAALKAQRE